MEPGTGWFLHQQFMGKSLECRGQIRLNQVGIQHIPAEISDYLNS